MTSAVEFTYLYGDFSLRINESVMTRAVRIKTAVKDKIKRVFDGKENVSNNGNAVLENKAKESLIDLSKEKLLSLNNALNFLQTEQKVYSNANRAVLFTQPLVAKIYRVTKKWFDGMPIVERKEVVTSDIPSVNMINHLGGEVVPGNWDQVEEKKIELPSEPTLEAVPMVSTEVSTEQPAKNVDIEIPTSLGNTDVYRFPSFDFNLESVAPVLEPVTQKVEQNNISVDFVPEPKQINEMAKNASVSEPILNNNGFEFNLPNFETVVNTEMPRVEEPSVLVANDIKLETPSVESVSAPTNEREEKINELLNKKFVSNPSNNFVPEYVDNRPAEEKIGSLLGRTTMVKATIPEVSSPTEVEEPVVSQNRDDKPELTQAHVLARLRRVTGTMADKEATIKNLTSKNDSLRQELSANKDKLSEYEIKVSDLTAKNSDLLSQNERLTAKLEEVETSSKSTIARLEAKVDELTQAKTDELESLRKQLEELKEKHASEISSMREKHALELKAANDSKEKQIQAIYATITEALGDDDYSKSMAA